MKCFFKNEKSFGEMVSDLFKLIIAQLCTKKFWFELFVMTAGMFVAAVAVYFFLIPSKLIIGSITGLSLVCAKILPIMSVGTYIFIINGILLVLSFILIGNEFGIKTVYTALILGPMVDLLGKLYPITESIFAQHIAGTDQVITNPWFDLITFVLVLSASQSILFSINASTGGLDILAKIINKYLHVSLGTSVTIGGGLICCTAFAINPPALVIIGLIGTWVNGAIVNYFMAGMNSKIRVHVITDDHEKLLNFILNDVKRGVTIHEVTGAYENVKRVQLETIVTEDDLSKIIDFMHNEDIKSFMSCDTVSAVYGIWNKKSLLTLTEH